MLVGAACCAQEAAKVYDQVGTPTGDATPVSTSYFPVRTKMPLGQSFTPALSEIGFVELYLRESPGMGNPGESETLVLTLREGDITDPVVSSTQPMFLLGGAFGPPFIQEFRSPATGAVTPGSKYTFELVHLAGGDLFGPAAYSANLYDYPGGERVRQGVPRVGSDLWFREGLFIPEPSVVWLLLTGLGFGGGWNHWRKRRSARQGPG
jgi:hypothetical protein